MRQGFPRKSRPLALPAVCRRFMVSRGGTGASRPSHPSGMAEDVVIGLLKEDVAYGRPLGLVADTRGAPLITDDPGNEV